MSISQAGRYLKQLNEERNRGYVEGQLHMAREILTKTFIQWQAKEAGISEELQAMVKRLDEMSKEL